MGLAAALLVGWAAGQRIPEEVVVCDELVTALLPAGSPPEVPAIRSARLEVRRCSRAGAGVCPDHRLEARGTLPKLHIA